MLHSGERNLSKKFSEPLCPLTGLGTEGQPSGNGFRRKEIPPLKDTLCTTLLLEDPPNLLLKNDDSIRL